MPVLLLLNWSLFGRQASAADCQPRPCSPLLYHLSEPPLRSLVCLTQRPLLLRLCRFSAPRLSARKDMSTNLLSGTTFTNKLERVASGTDSGVVKACEAHRVAESLDARVCASARPAGSCSSAVAHEWRCVRAEQSLSALRWAWPSGCGVRARPIWPPALTETSAGAPGLKLASRVCLSALIRLVFSAFINLCPT